MSNREIKFRAWDNEYKLMLYPKAYYVSQWEFNTQEIKDKAWLDYNIWELYNPESNEYVSILNYKQATMQYTWLKDKNWNEIYEWDILDYTNAQIIISIRWDYTWARRKFDFNIAKNSIIIWNIYENPDLIDW